MLTTLCVDLDGVLRHWDNSALAQLEALAGLEPGGFARRAFEPALLEDALTGRLSHAGWLEAIALSLQRDGVAPPLAQALVDTWSQSPSRVDVALLESMRAAAPQAAIALVTNATDRLDDDLADSGLGAMLDHVVNSSAIGVMKPQLGFYRHVMQVTGAEAGEMVWIEDEVSHVQVAAALGMEAIRHREPAETLRRLRRLAR